MDSSKVIIIYNEDNIEKHIVDGKIEQYGNIEEAEFHSLCLLECAKEKYPEVEIFKKLKYTHTPETIAFFFIKLGNIIFLNTSKQGYKMMGTLILPDNITDKQQQAISLVATSLKDFEIRLTYNLKLTEGVLEDNEETIDGNNLEEWIKDYCKKNKIK